MAIAALSTTTAAQQMRIVGKGANQALEFVAGRQPQRLQRPGSRLLLTLPPPIAHLRDLQVLLRVPPTRFRPMVAAVLDLGIHAWAPKMATVAVSTATAASPRTTVERAVRQAMVSATAVYHHQPRYLHHHGQHRVLRLLRVPQSLQAAQL